MIDLRAPFPYFGGKSRAAPLVWERFGTVINYVEPFFGSGAVLLSCPEAQRPRVETVNDLSCFLANFWRATKGDPDAVASAADYPVIETDLHARHRWLLAQAADLRARLDADPDYFDARVAGWWAWGASAWIGTGWCEEGKEVRIQAPDLGGSTSGDKTYPNHGKGVNAAGMRAPSVRLPDLGGGTQWGTSEPNARAGRGVHSQGARGPSRKLPALGGNDRGDGTINHGVGVHAIRARGPSQKLPRLDGNGGTEARGDGKPGGGAGVHAFGNRTRLFDIFAALAQRLRHVRVAVAGRARAWALQAGERVDMRVALCGYEGEHPMPATWECVPWKAKGGYSNAAREGNNGNARRERIWFSPACLRPGVNAGQLSFLGT